MSIDSTSSSIHCKKALKSSLSDNNNFPYSRHSLKDCQNRALSKSRTMSICEETSGDLLTELSSLPFSSSKQPNNKCSRRFSELKPPLVQQKPIVHAERRNSSPQISLGFVLPNPFRSKKHNHKHTSKDDTHTPSNTFNNNFSLHHNDMMTMKIEQPLPSRPLNLVLSNSRTNSLISNDLLSSPTNEDSTSSISSLSTLFTIQINQLTPRSAEHIPFELHTTLCIGDIYLKYFYEYFHVNYYGEFEQDGAFLASLRYFNNKTDNNNTSTDTTTTYSQARALIRTSTRNYDVSMTLDGINEENILQILFHKADLSTIHTHKPIGDPKANEKIYSFDKLNDERQNCKIGVIFQGTEQSNEYDIFSNDGLSEQMLKFLKILADPVRLKGFNKYRGDLDIKDDLHGPESYYTKYNSHEIMFNVAPIIPSTKANGQCIERKSLVGNSFVCIVFQDPDVEFSPDIISGKVTQIYITVKPCITDEQLYYKINIWHRNDFTTSIDPTGGTIKCDASFRDYFLTLLLNSITAAIESPSLRFRVAEQRKRLKQEEFKKLLQSLSIGQILDVTNEIDNTQSHSLKRTNSRTDSIASLGAQSTSESVVSSSGRISPVSTKKGRISKIFGVLTGRSGSISSATSTASLSVNSSFYNTNSNESNTTQQGRATKTVNKENDKRRLSVKYRRAPAPPPTEIISQTTLPQVPSSLTQLNTYNPLLTPPPTSSQSFDALDESVSKENNTLNTTVFEEFVRNRSNSSPDGLPLTSRILLSNVTQIKEESDSTNSSTDYEGENDESIEYEKFEHRQTLTETPLILPVNTNS